jgi:hypothetical protein
MERIKESVVFIYRRNKCLLHYKGNKNDVSGLFYDSIKDFIFVITFVLNNMTMSITEQTANFYFLNLLSAAIWDRPLEAHVFEGIDKSVWKEIADIAYKQSVRAVYFCG